MPSPSPKQLLVEGRGDLRVIAHLMGAHIPWGDDGSDPPVHIKDYDGIDNLLGPGVISTELKASDLQALGIVVDANDDVVARWDAVRTRCLTSFPDIPGELPETGLIDTNEAGLRLGVWLMPDNRTAGMLETFLGYLVPEGGDALWAFAQQASEQAREQHGAPFRQPHTDKAFVHAWLAWQDPPGAQLHQAVFKHILDPTSGKAQPFIDWFRQLFEL